MFNVAAQDWFAKNSADGWATCPLTENGFVRVASQPRYANRPGDTGVVVGILREMCSLESHRFWPDDLSIRDVLRPDAVVTPSQITDLYLLALAVRNGGKLVTFDRRVPATVVQGGPDALEVIGSQSKPVDMARRP